ncbi:MAG TPA: hypothetical protein VMD02_03830 [Candidatus Omnitrophota bacterium]|nr:hypothetical protein [Candidatus Omnitrophota bacterium]
MKTVRLGIAVIALLVPALLLSGCKSTLLVRNATVAQMIPILKDYAGTHGYNITYENDQTGSFRLDLGPVYVAGTTSTTRTKSVTVTPPSKDQPMTSYEDTTWNTVSTPGHYDEATAMVTLIQSDNDVVITVDGNDAAGSSMSDVHSYLASFGYTVEDK